MSHSDRRYYKPILDRRLRIIVMKLWVMAEATKAKEAGGALYPLRPMNGERVGPTSLCSICTDEMLDTCRRLEGPLGNGHDLDNVIDYISGRADASHAAYTTAMEEAESHLEPLQRFAPVSRRV